MVLGLTGVINQKSDIYMEPYKLHDTQIIVDGSSISQRLFVAHFELKNCYFNGDYDRYADIVRSFFQLLQDCNITPCILFDGNYASNKQETVLTRMQKRINNAANPNFDSVSERPHIIFPMCLGEIFIDIAKEYNTKVIYCNYESERECAKIACYLNCPLLSYDSRFYIFDVLYIPFNTLKLRSITCLITRNNEKQIFKYVSCQMFNRYNFLNDTGLEKDVLPIFAVLLGDNYIPRNTFRLFYEQFFINITYAVENLSSHFSRKTKETVIQEILTIYNSEEKRDIFDLICNSVDNYTITEEENSEYLKYFKLDNSYLVLDKTEDENKVDDCVKSSGSSSEMVSLFINNFRKCLYPSYFISIFLHNTYFTMPQVEDISLPSTHLVNTEIISAIHKILRPTSEPLLMFTWSGLAYQEYSIPLCTTAVPLYTEIQNIDINSRQRILFNILNIDKSFVNFLNNFPDSWKLFTITIKYLCEKSSITWSLIYSLILCKIIINYVDIKLAKFIRDPEDDIFQIKLDKKAYPVFEQTIEDALNDITYEDSLLALKSVIDFFVVNPKIIRNDKLFDRTIIHSIAEFQSCLFHIKSLNSLLNLPFENCPMMSCFNGTFLYNFINEMKQCLFEEIQDLLEESPTILKCFNLMVTHLKKEIDISS